MNDKHDLWLIVYSIPVILTVLVAVLPFSANGQPLVQHGIGWMYFMGIWTVLWVIGFIIVDIRRNKKL